MDMDPDTRARYDALANAYRRVFGVAGQRSREQMLVWADLVHFCRAHMPTYSETDRESAMREGRREVFLRLSQPLTVREPTVAEILAQSGFTEVTSDE